MRVCVVVVVALATKFLNKSESESEAMYVSFKPTQSRERERESVPANLHANMLYNSNNTDYRSNDEKDDNVGGEGGKRRTKER